MTYDYVTVAIGASTNDVVADHPWRDQIPGTGPHADIATLLTHAADDFATTAAQLDAALSDLSDRCGQHLRSLAGQAAIPRPTDLDSTALRVTQLTEQFEAQRHTLICVYQLWRRHHSFQPATVRYLWISPYLPEHGMVRLDGEQAVYGRQACTVTADTTALATFGLPDNHRRRLGEVVAAGDVWHTAAYPLRESEPSAGLVTWLPTAGTPEAACRALLRWTAMRHAGAVPDADLAQLSAEQQAALTA